MASEPNVTRLTKRLKTSYSQHAPQVLTISSCLVVQIKGWNPAGLTVTPVFNSWSWIRTGQGGLM